MYTCIKSKLVEHKKPGLISYFGVPFRQRNATCQFLAATEEVCCIKLYLGAVQLSIVSPTELVLERL